MYPMYKAFIEPDLQTAHIKIINKFNPFTGFQSPTYILKVNIWLLKSVLVSILANCHYSFPSIELVWLCDTNYCSHRGLWPLIRSRLLSPLNIQKLMSRLMIYIFYHLVKIQKLANHIWGCGIKMENTVLCLRFAPQIIYSLSFCIMFVDWNDQHVSEGSTVLIVLL